MPNVFLSYSRTDAEIVEKIAGDLRRQGIGSWIDRHNLIGGQEWQPQIEHAISDADFMVVLLSKSSLASPWVRLEYEKALGRQLEAGGTRLIPALIEQVDLPPSIARVQYVDFTESYFEGMQQLLRALEVSTAGPELRELFQLKGFARELAGEVAKYLAVEKTLGAGPPDGGDQRLVFVIMSFSDDMEPIFEGIKAAGGPLGLEVLRVMDVVGDYKITDQIVHMIRNARLVVADLTHERPNVYFELGYARGLGKRVITIARNDAQIHFDVKDWMYIPYTDSRILERDLRQRFEHELSAGNDK